MTFPIFSPEFIREICVAMTTWTFRMFGICMNLNNFFSFLGTGIKPERERERKEEDEIFRCPGGAPGEVLEWAQPPATLSIFCVSSVKSNFHSSPTPTPVVLFHPNMKSSDYLVSRNFWNIFRKFEFGANFFSQKIPKKSGKIAKIPQSNFPLDNLDFH